MRRRLAIVAAIAAVAYVGLIGTLAFRESALVYVSAGAGKRGRIIPGADATIPWDTLRVPDGSGRPVFLLRSMLEQPRRYPWVIFFHGNAGFVGSRSSVERYELLRDAGFNVLAVEYRGYGASVGGGQPSEEAIMADARAALFYLTGALDVPSERIAAYGWSLGSGPATQLVADAQLGALITEGAFTSLPDVGAETYPWVPVRAVMRNRFDNVAVAPRVRAPWLILHGDLDREIPFAHAERLAKAAATERLVSLEAGHDDGVVADRERALGELRRIALHLGAPDPGDPRPVP